MTENEAISRIKDHMEIHRLKEPRAIYITVALSMAITALKEIQQYREIGTVEECKELASMVTTEKKNVLGQIVDEWKEYIEIGTMEECRKSVEKQIAKQCDIDSCPDHIHYKCPSCGQIELSVYKHGFPRLGRITKYCENCGQALIDIENLEGMEDENT